MNEEIKVGDWVWVWEEREWQRVDNVQGTFVSTEGSVGHHVISQYSTNPVIPPKPKKKMVEEICAEAQRQLDEALFTPDRNALTRIIRKHMKPKECEGELVDKWNTELIMWQCGEKSFEMDGPHNFCPNCGGKIVEEVKP